MFCLLHLIRDTTQTKDHMMEHTRHSRIQPHHGLDRTGVRTGVGFVSESFLKVGCVNLPANGLAKASLLFRTRPLSTEGVSTRLISGGSPEVPPAIRAWASGGASTQTRLMEPQITPPLSSPYSHASTLPWLFISLRGGLAASGAYTPHRLPP